MVKITNYIIIDLDDVKSETDRQLCLKYFRDKKLKVVLGAGRRPYNIKGVMQVEPVSPKEGKLILDEIQVELGDICKVDKTVMHRASYQAPINKHQVLLNQTNHLYKEHRKPKIEIKISQNLKTTDKIETICVKMLNEKGFSFNTPTQDGYKCSHPSERKSPNGFTWSREYPFSMVHWNPDRNISVWEEVIKTPEYKEYQLDQSDSLVASVMPVSEGTHNDRYLGNNAEIVTDFLDNYKMLKIQSPMGSAKSTVLEEVLHQCSKRDLRVLFLTNRISLADDICHKYPGIKHYQGTELENTEYQPGDNLALQIDSFHKFSTKYFDVVILDEFTTTAIKLLSIEKHQRTAVTKFFSLQKKKLVLADAFLFPEMTKIFASEDETINIINAHRDQVQLEIIEQKNGFVSELIEAAKEGPISFSSGSTMMLKIVQHLADLNGLTWFSIDSQTPKNQKELVYESLRNKKAKWDILMYSPSLTVGVSNENEICTHFHFDSGLSMDVLSSIQMIKRTRKATKIKMYLSERIGYNPTDLSGIQGVLPDYSEQDQDGDDLGITVVGNNLSKIIRIHNILENRHQKSFMKLLAFQFLSLESIVYNKSSSKINVHQLSKIIKAKELNQKINIFEEYRKMNPEEIGEIDMKLFGTTPEEIFIKEFELHKSDETLVAMNLGQDLDNIIRENIKTPNTIEHLKNQTKNPIPNRQGTVSNNLYNKYFTQGTDLKEYGFTKRKHIWVLNPVIKHIQERII